MSKVATLLQAGAVLGRRFQPYESHIPFLLQLKVCGGKACGVVSCGLLRCGLLTSVRGVLLAGRHVGCACLLSA